MRLVYLIVSYVASILLESVGFHWLDLQHVGDDDVEVHFSTGRVFLHCQRLSSSFLL